MGPQTVDRAGKDDLSTKGTKGDLEVAPFDSRFGFPTTPAPTTQTVDRSGKEDLAVPAPANPNFSLDWSEVFGPPTPAVPGPPAPAPTTQTTPFGPNPNDPFAPENEPTHGPPPGATPSPSRGTPDTPSRGLDLSNLSLEFANPDLGLLGAPSPSQNTGLGLGGQTNPVFDPRRGVWVDPSTGRPVGSPPPPSLMSMWSPIRGG